LLAGYLGFRYAIFGTLSSASIFSSIQTLPYVDYVVWRTLWLSPISAQNVFSAPVTSIVKATLLLASPLLLLMPFVWLPVNKRPNYARAIIFFAVLWPVVSTVFLFGAGEPRHFYLASAGVAIAFGLAASVLLTSGRFAASLGLVVMTLLLALYGAALVSGIAQYARNGNLSRALANRVDQVIADAAPDPSAVIVIIPEFPQPQVHFWDYFYPDAVNPPFRATVAPANIVPSFASCHCPVEQWKMDNTAALTLLTDSKTGPVYVVMWDEDQSAFVTRVLSQPAFWQAGHDSPSSALLQPGRPGLPAATLP